MRLFHCRMPMAGCRSSFGCIFGFEDAKYGGAAAAHQCIEGTFSSHNIFDLSNGRIMGLRYLFQNIFHAVCHAFEIVIVESLLHTINIRMDCNLIQMQVFINKFR